MAQAMDREWIRIIGTCCPAARPHVHRLVLDFELDMVLATDLCAISGGVVYVAAICESFVI